MSVAGTPGQAKSKGRNFPSLNDSGYDGLCSGTKGKNTATKTFNSEGVRRLLEMCSRTSQDQFWITTTNILILVVMGASVAYLLLMGDKSISKDLGGKKAAIQHYYNTVYGLVDDN